MHIGTQALKSRSESNDSRFEVPTWIKWFAYAIRLDRFETVNNFATQWFNWFVKQLHWNGVLCSLSLYNLFIVWANGSVDDAVNMGLHFILQHLDRPGTYVRILFVDFSSAFNTIIPDTLQNKLTQLSVPTSVCQWITSFLTDRQQLVRLGKLSSSTRTIYTGAPQGCVLSPLLFSLYMNDCTSKDPSVKLLKFADDTTLIGLIQDGDESANWQTGG